LAQVAQVRWLFPAKISGWLVPINQTFAIKKLQLDDSTDVCLCRFSRVSVRAGRPVYCRQLCQLRHV
jgi:hypothetical protein